MPMPSLFPPTTAATSVATPTPRSSAQPRDNSAMCAVSQVTLWHCANNREDGKLAGKPHAEMSTLPKEAKADLMDAAPAVLPVDTATVAPAIACPTLLPTVPLIVHPPTIQLTLSPLHSPLVLPGFYWGHPSWQYDSQQSAQGSLYTEKASDGHTAFYTQLQLPSHDGMKHMTVKIDSGAQVNTIPLSKYHTLFPPKLKKSRFPKAKALLPTAHTWISQDGSPKPFLGHFVTDVRQASEPRPYPTWFYMFEDATSPHILFSYATLERLGIIAFNVPNLAATSWVDNIAVSTSPPKVAWGRLPNVSHCGTPLWKPTSHNAAPSPYRP